MLIISLLGIVVFIVLNIRKLKVFRGHLFSNAIKIMLFISDAQYCAPVKLCRTVGSIHLFRQLLPEHVKLNKHILWDIIEIDWKEVNMTLNGNKIKLYTSVVIPLKDKFKMRRIIKKRGLAFSYYGEARNDMVSSIGSGFSGSSIILIRNHISRKWLSNWQSNLTWYVDS